MRIRYQADLDLKRAIVKGVTRRQPLVDFRTAQSAGLEGLDDLAVSLLAAQDARIVVSHDVSTMPKHFRQFAARHDSPGVFLISQELSIGAAIENLLLIW